MFTIKPDTPTKELGDGIIIVSGPGGSPWVTDTARPHLGGNFDGGDLGTWYKTDLWPWLISEFQTRWFSEHGCMVTGVEGLPWNVKKCRERGPQPVLEHDFNNGPCVFDNVDLIWCADVAEHIEERFVQNFLNTLRQCNVLAMCQGGEGNADDGWHHVNNKPEQYWIDHLAAVGMIEDVGLSARSREIGNHGWWEHSGRIYRRIRASNG